MKLGDQPQANKGTGAQPRDKKVPGTSAPAPTTHSQLHDVIPSQLHKRVEPSLAIESRPFAVE